MSHVLTTPATGFSALLRPYAAALLPALFLLFGAVQTAIADGTVSAEEGGQIIALVAGLVITFWVPLVKGRWAGALKTGAAVLAAIATLIIPLVTGFTWQALIIVAIAVLQALMTEIGVQVRVPVDLRNATGVPDVTSLESTAAID